MHRETGAYHKKFLGHNQKWLTEFIFLLFNFSENVVKNTETEYNTNVKYD